MLWGLSWNLGPLMHRISKIIQPRVESDLELESEGKNEAIPKKKVLSSVTRE